MIRVVTIFSLLLLLQHPLCAQYHFNLPENQHPRHLVIVHPTRSNLERYTFLLKQGILNPGELKIVGLCFEAEKYNYEEVITAYRGIAFHMVPGKLSPEVIYPNLPVIFSKKPTAWNFTSGSGAPSLYLFNNSQSLATKKPFWSYIAHIQYYGLL